MPIKGREELKSYFIRNAIPTEQNFADFIDSSLSLGDDGVSKPPGEALNVVAVETGQQRVLGLSASAGGNPNWWLCLNPGSDPDNAETNRAGFGIIDAERRIRLFIDSDTGNVGVGINDPAAALDVGGAARATRLTAGSLGITGQGTIADLQVSTRASIAGVPIASGRVDGRDVAQDGAVLEQHVAHRTNPHQVTAAQAGALALTGGTLTGTLTIQEDNIGAQYNVSSDANTSKIGARFNVSGNAGSMYGTYLQLTGAGTKYGTYAQVSGTGNQWGSRTLVSGDDAGAKYGVQCLVSGNDGTKYGVQCQVSGNDGTKLGVQSVVSGDDGTKYGAYVTVSGEAGNKRGLYASVSGTDGDKRGLEVNVSGNNANKYGAIFSVSGNTGAGYGVYSTVGNEAGVSPPDRNRFAGYFNGKVYVQTKLGIGTTIPAGDNRLDVSGNVFFRSSVGIGISDPGNDRLDVRGRAYSSSGWFTTNADYAELFETADGADILPATSVVVDEGKVKPAPEGTTPIGIVSATPAVVGNSFKEWPDKYLYDELGRPLMEEYEEEIMVPKKPEVTAEPVVTPSAPLTPDEHAPAAGEDGHESAIAEPELAPPEVVTDENGEPIMVGTGEFVKKQRPRLNPDYDPELEYTRREDRPEWVAVGLLGQLRLRKGQPVAPTWVKLKDLSGDIELWLVK